SPVWVTIASKTLPAVLVRSTCRGPPHSSAAFAAGVPCRRGGLSSRLTSVKNGSHRSAIVCAQANGRRSSSEPYGSSDMRGFVDNIEKLTEDNSDFRRVLYTGKNLQLVLMSIEPGDDIGEEVHEDGDQFFRVEQGSGTVSIDGNRSEVKADDAFIVPSGARHNLQNSGQEPLRVY